MGKFYSVVKFIAFWGFMLFAFIGLLITAVLAHELSHFEDYKKIAVDDNLCFLNWPIHGFNWETAAGGIYSFGINDSIENVTEQYAAISKTTEIKAYIIFFVIMLAGGVLFFIINLDERAKHKFVERTLAAEGWKITSNGYERIENGN